MKVVLNADPERTVTIPITKTEQGGVSKSDYSGVPENVELNAGDTGNAITFTASHDTVDDDGESVNLGFGAMPFRVSVGTSGETTVTINDDDDPEIKVSFDVATYGVAEGSMIDLPPVVVPPAMMLL